MLATSGVSFCLPPYFARARGASGSSNVVALPSQPAGAGRVILGYGQQRGGESALLMDKLNEAGGPLHVVRYSPGIPAV